MVSKNAFKTVVGSRPLQRCLENGYFERGFFWQHRQLKYLIYIALTERSFIVSALRHVPRYYFHLINDVDAPDKEGVDLLNLVDARRHARTQALFTAGETVKLNGTIDLRHRIDIEDHRGNVLGTVRFGDVIAVAS